VVVENLGFAFNSVMPVVANEILDVGPEGLGLLGTAAGVGSIFGTAGLALLGNFQRKGLLLLAVVGGFGGLLMAMAATDLFVPVLVITALLGAAMATVDALQWILLQANVEDEYRGRVVGAWNLAIGLGWLGPILLGGTAEALGVQNALALFGALLLTTGIVAGGSRRLRAA
jgi:MFS family permease